MDDALLKSLGDETVGVVSAGRYSASFDSSSNKRFVADMEEDYGVPPGVYSAGTYIAGQCVEAALEKSGGNADDRMATLHKVQLTDTPRGAFHFDDLGNVVGTVFIRKCERRDGKLTNTVIKTYPNVSQFWTYGEHAFLANPVYSRDYPPAKNLVQ
jgi:branched-chain amino acid transport system substrate-binding protein